LVLKGFGLEKFWLLKVLFRKGLLAGSIWFTIPRSAHSMRRRFMLALLSESAATQEQRLHRLLTTARHKP
jgi:hypothetical protein